jgi:hypothetical protein
VCQCHFPLPSFNWTYHSSPLHNLHTWCHLLPLHVLVFFKVQLHSFMLITIIQSKMHMQLIGEWNIHMDYSYPCTWSMFSWLRNHNYKKHVNQILFYFYSSTDHVFSVFSRPCLTTKHY